MRTLIVVCFLGLASVVLGGKAGGYTDKFDNINLDEILSNRRLLIPYIKCALGTGKCSPPGLELKAHIQEALEQNCAKCSEPQRAGARRVLAHLINHEPEYWNQLVAKYDPHHKFMRKYEQELKTIKH